MVLPVFYKATIYMFPLKIVKTVMLNSFQHLTIVKDGQIPKQVRNDTIFEFYFIIVVTAI